MNKHDVAVQLRTYIDYLLENSSAAQPMWNIEMIRSGKPNKWNYIDGCMITAILALHRITGEKRYLQFADDFMGWFVQEDGSINTYLKEEYNLDHVNPAKNLFYLLEHTQKNKYRLAMDTVRSQLDTMPRIAAGNFWHKKIYPHQVWLDGLYMAQPFYMQYEMQFHAMHGCLDSFTQFQTVYDIMRNSKTGLYAHGYDESRQMSWADAATGLSANCWLRAQGWFFMALVDTIEAMDEQMYYEKRTLQKMLLELASALRPWQHESGMFYQVIDKPQAQGNYLETSGTAIVAYALLKAVRLHLLPKTYQTIGEAAFYGTAQKYLSQQPDGTLTLGGICLVAGLGGEQQRDGSLNYYFSEPVVENEAKGVAPMLLAYTEILALQ